MSDTKNEKSAPTSHDVTNPKEPEVFRNRTDPVTMSALVLTVEQGDNAVKTLVRKEFTDLKFPKVTRLRKDPPCPGNQHYCLHTFIPSKGATPDKDNIFGIMKCRGTYSNLSEADQWMNKLVREVDSNHEIWCSYVGVEFPVTTDDKFCKDINEIDLQKKMNQIAKDDLMSKKDEEKKSIQDIEDRKQELLEPSKDIKEKAVDDMEAYITLRTKRASLRQYLDNLEKKAKEVGKLIKNHSAEIHKMDDKHPEFEKTYKAKYEKGIKEVGADPKMNELMAYM